jgi:quinoprotein glucose dehydrogenase
MTRAFRVASVLVAGLTAGLGAAAQTTPPPRTLAAGVYTAEQAGRGRAAYQQHCAECHMADLAGHEYAGALAGYGFQLKWQDASVAELLGRVRSMPLGRPGSLTPQEYVDIVAYVLQRNTYPAGESELTAKSAGGWPPIRIERVLRTPDPSRP